MCFTNKNNNLRSKKAKAKDLHILSGLRPRRCYDVVLCYGVTCFKDHSAILDIPLLYICITPAVVFADLINVVPMTRFELEYAKNGLLRCIT